MNSNKTRWFIEKQIDYNRLAVHCIHEDERGRFYVEYREGMVDMSPSEARVGEPSLAWSDNDAQQIMNELWLAGIRPRDGAGHQMKRC
jgi:hypothetical protein